ncbi:MAG: MaoC/PaaZ C-terminal domain-containing protein [Anaerolineae bacterium]|jgi:acyl dehydratase
MTKRFFEDVKDGERLVCRPVSLTRDEIVAFATAFDPQPFHVDDDAAKASVFGGLIASSLHVLAACTRAVVEAQGDVAILSGVGMDEARMFAPVRPGDRLNVEAWWTDLRPSRSRPKQGLASIRCRVTNQDGDLVLQYGYRYLLARKA